MERKRWHWLQKRKISFTKLKLIEAYCKNEYVIDIAQVNNNVFRLINYASFCRYLLNCCVAKKAKSIQIPTI